MPIGVYPYPPDPDAHIGAIQLSALPGTSAWLGIQGARWLTRIETYLGHLLPL